MPDSASPAGAGTPAEVLRDMIETLTARDYDRLPEIYADDVVVEHAFGVGERTRWEGMPALLEHFSRSPVDVLELAVRDLAVYGTDDPEVAVAEFNYDVRVLATGRAATVPNVIIARVRGGRIVATRDYHHHAVLAALFDGLPEYAKAVEASLA